MLKIQLSTVVLTKFIFPAEAGNNVQDPSGPTPRKRKAEEDPEEPTLFKAPQNTQRRRKRKLSNEATTSSGKGLSF